MSVPLNLLESLIAIKELGSLARAADDLNMTQPALSMQLKKLEEYFKFPLFETQGKKKILTVYGLSVYAESKRILSEFENSFESIDRKYLQAEQMKLKVGCRRELLFDVQKKINFKGQIHFEILTSADSLQALERGQVDIAVSRYRPDSTEIIAKKIITSCPWLIVNRKWISKFQVDDLIFNHEFLTTTPLIAYTKDCELMQDWLKHVKLKTQDLNLKYTSPDWLNILQMVEYGFGYAVIPDSIESNLKSVLQLELSCKVVQSETYYFLYKRSFAKIPVFEELLKNL